MSYSSQANIAPAAMPEALKDFLTGIKPALTTINGGKPVSILLDNGEIEEAVTTARTVADSVVVVVGYVDGLREVQTTPGPGACISGQASIRVFVHGDAKRNGALLAIASTIANAVTASTSLGKLKLDRNPDHGTPMYAARSETFPHFWEILFAFPFQS